MDEQEAVVALSDDSTLEEESVSLIASALLSGMSSATCAGLLESFESLQADSPAISNSPKRGRNVLFMYFFL